MSTHEKAARPGEVDARLKCSNPNAKEQRDYITRALEQPFSVARRLHKIDFILLILCTRSLNAQEAQRYGDSCLHSTISDIAARRGIWCQRAPEARKNFVGRKITFSRYWLAEEDRGKALRYLTALLEGDQARRRPRARGQG